MTNASIQVLTPGVNLTMTGVISESASGSSFSMAGAFGNYNQIPSTLTLSSNNNYSGPTYVAYHGILAIPTIGGRPPQPDRHVVQ